MGIRTNEIDKMIIKCEVMDDRKKENVHLDVASTPLDRKK